MIRRCLTLPMWSGKLLKKIQYRTLDFNFDQGNIKETLILNNMDLTQSLGCQFVNIPAKLKTTLIIRFQNLYNRDNLPKNLDY